MKPNQIHIGDRVRINRGMLTGRIGSVIDSVANKLLVRIPKEAHFVGTPWFSVWQRHRDLTKLSSEPVIPGTHVVLNTNPHSKVHPGIELQPDQELRIRVIHHDARKSTLDISTVKVAPIIPQPPPVPPLPPFLPIDLRGELFSWLAKQEVTSKNIGKIRESCMVPWDSKWNSMVLDATAAVEQVATSQQEGPTPAPGASPSPLDPPNGPNAPIAPESFWRPRSVFPAQPGTYKTIRWQWQTSNWNKIPYLEAQFLIQDYTGNPKTPWLVRDGEQWVADDNFSHWLNRDLDPNDPNR